MKLMRSYLASGVLLARAMCALALCVLFFMAPTLAMAQVNGLNASVYSRNPNLKPLGTVTVTANSTFTTTSFVLLPGSSLTYTPSRDPNQLCAPGESCPAPHLHVILNVAASKSTASYGVCELYANGALITTTARQTNYAAGQQDLTIFADITESVSGSQTVSVYCASGDTNTFTVIGGQAYYEELY
jgi:hypothetical protein